MKNYLKLSIRLLAGSLLIALIVAANAVQAAAYWHLGDDEDGCSLGSCRCVRMSQ